MKTVQVTIEDELLADVDAAVAALETSRSAFVREALRLHAVRRLEAQHRAGYERVPQRVAESEMWCNEQSWE